MSILSEQTKGVAPSLANWPHSIAGVWVCGKEDFLSEVISFLSLKLDTEIGLLLPWVSYSGKFLSV